jgi:peptide/nickel transport system substrate-binding protein
MKRWINQQSLPAVCAALVAMALIAGCGGSSHKSSSANATETTGSSSAVLTVESSQQNAITKNFNPYIQSSAAALLGATSLIYEPLLQTNAIKPGQYYNWLATGYSWSNGGKSITFTIRPGVKWSDGTPMTAADVAFTFNMLKKYPDVNTTGLAVKSVSTTGNQVTLNFATPQYANLQNIAGQTYIVPQAVWSKVGDPGKYADPDPVGTGPYGVSQFSSQGITLKANPS